MCVRASNSFSKSYIDVNGIILLKFGFEIYRKIKEKISTIIVCAHISLNMSFRFNMFIVF